MKNYTSCIKSFFESIVLLKLYSQHPFQIRRTIYHTSTMDINFFWVQSNRTAVWNSVDAHLEFRPQFRRYPSVGDLVWVRFWLLEHGEVMVKIVGRESLREYSGYVLFLTDSRARFLAVFSAFRRASYHWYRAQYVNNINGMILDCISKQKSFFTFRRFRIGFIFYCISYSFSFCLQKLLSEFVRVNLDWIILIKYFTTISRCTFI